MHRRHSKPHPYGKPPTMPHCVTVTIGAAIEKLRPGDRRPCAVPIVCFVYCPALDDNEPEEQRKASVRDANTARAMLDRITGFGSGEIIEGWPSEDEYRHFWRVTMQVSRAGSREADIALDYCAAPDCPFDQRQDMMHLYHHIARCLVECRAERGKDAR